MTTNQKKDPKTKGPRRTNSARPNKTAANRSVRIEFPDGNAVQLKKNAPAGKALEEWGTKTPHPVVAAKFRNKVCSLRRPLDRGGKLEPVHLGTRDGALIYRRSLSFMLVRAVAELFPDLRVYINHSLDRGYYGEAYCEDYRREGPVRLSPLDLQAIERRMREYAERDEPIERMEYPLEEAIELFRRADMQDKVDLLKYSAPGLVSVYRFGNEINHFYGQLAPSAGFMKHFALKPTPPGFVLLFPSMSAPDRLPEYRHQAMLFEVFKEYERWMRILEWRTVAQLNAMVDAGRAREYVHIAEALHEKKLAAIADMITNHPGRPRVVLLSGPSGSGKTTSVKRLAIQLRVNGARPVVIGLDDFFVDRDDTPKDERGEYDFESFRAIDVNKLQRTVRALLRGRQVTLPRFDFQLGRGVEGESVRLEEDQILILEGIHALNDQLLPTIPDGLKFKIYASPLTHLNVDDHNRISSRDARLLRRVVRDFNYRGYDASETLKRWPSVRRGEEQNIFPYQENADVVFNSSLPYEIAVMKSAAVRVLKRVKRSEPVFSEAARLIKFLSYFREIPLEYVPRHSLLREFLGGSAFTY